ncbi:hypothetical protein B0H13DRAFT_1851366 [Mycena leptocephala]|nr:hypothetical protein B0H13DRAFT_1851366 [Mycena leptocephala]
MSRDSSHQHENPPGRSPARAAGTVHPRPRDDTPPSSESSPERDGHLSVIKSPHSRRPLKRRQTEGAKPLSPIAYNVPVVPDDIVPPPPPTAVYSEEALAEIQDELYRRVRSVVSLLDEFDHRAPPGSSYPDFMAIHTRNLYQRVHWDSEPARYVEPEPVAPAPAPITYASVAAPRVTIADPPRSALPPATKHSRPDRPSAPPPASPPTKAGKQRKAVPEGRGPHHSPHRLILRWTDSPPPPPTLPTVLLSRLSRRS